MSDWLYVAQLLLAVLCVVVAMMVAFVTMSTTMELIDSLLRCDSGVCASRMLRQMVAYGVCYG